MAVTELDIDLIDRINPFGEAYAILAKSMSEERLKQVAAVIAAKRSQPDDRGSARAWRSERCDSNRRKGRLPSLTAADPWEKRMAEGVALSSAESKESRMPERITDEDLELLSELGRRGRRRTRPAVARAREQRIIAGFEEIERFVQEHGRAPEHGENRDIFERIYAVRLDRHSRICGVPRTVEGSGFARAAR